MLILQISSLFRGGLLCGMAGGRILGSAPCVTLVPCARCQIMDNKCYIIGVTIKDEIVSKIV